MFKGVEKFAMIMYNVLIILKDLAKYSFEGSKLN